jgi:cytochrome c553
MKPATTMNRRPSHALAAAVALGSAAGVLLTPATGAAAVQDAGAEIAAQGLPKAGVAPCASCHGAHGEGNPAAGFPRLAGQSRAYLLRQLQSYADGSRNNATMTPIASKLSSLQRTSVAAYFARQIPTRATNAGGTPAQPDRRGETLAIWGDNAIHVQACNNCHGPQGVGEPVTFPALAGQGQTYLLSALKAWQDGSRHNDPSRQMPMIAKSLSQADMQAVAQYYAAQPPATPPQVPGSAAPENAAGVTSGPRGKTGATRGTGTEQGTPTTGGAQGPGGGGTQGPEPQ